jgi:outer membrane protein OmpA-like peptidoglycan-associated protein
VRQGCVQGDATDAARRLPCVRGRRAGWLAALAPAIMPVFLLGACSSVPSEINPVSWWHSLQGGAIAEQRPPPPGAADPYPNLASVPPAPPPPNRVAMQQITDSLIADRTNAQHEAAAAPLADPSSPTASPALFGTGTTPPPGPPGQTQKPGAPAPAAQPAPAPVASASMPAAPAPAPPPAPAAPPAKAPVGAVNSAPLAPPAAAGDTPAETAPLPTIAAAPPAAPTVPGFPVPTPPATTAPAPPPATLAGSAVTVPFPDGSALLPASATAPLKQLAAKRGGGRIAVVGFGEAAAATPDAQSTALTLGLARAQAMAAVLTASGVPAGAVQIDAQAIGHGGSARLVQ